MLPLAHSLFTRCPKGVLAGSLLGMAVACGVRLTTPDNEKRDSAAVMRRPVEDCTQLSRHAQCYQRTTYDVCPNYFPALEALEEALGCAGRLAPRRATQASDSRRQRCHRA